MNDAVNDLGPWGRRPRPCLLAGVRLIKRREVLAPGGYRTIRRRGYGGHYTG